MNVGRFFTNTLILTLVGMFTVMKYVCGLSEGNLAVSSSKGPPIG